MKEQTEMQLIHALLEDIEKRCRVTRMRIEETYHPWNSEAEPEPEREDNEEKEYKTGNTGMVNV